VERLVTKINNDFAQKVVRRGQDRGQARLPDPEINKFEMGP
jgi:hypothetical protein